VFTDNNTISLSLDVVQKNVYELSEKDYADAFQHEIDQQTISCLEKKSVKSEAPWFQIYL
jgi:hypothetical protein